MERVKKLDISFVDDLISIINLIKLPTIGILYDPNYLTYKNSHKVINDHIDLMKIIKWIKGKALSNWTQFYRVRFNKINNSLNSEIYTIIFKGKKSILNLQINDQIE